MLKQSSPIAVSQLRNMKRNQSLLNYTVKDLAIGSAKEIKKVRSTKQIDVTTYKENKNQKIKNIDQKLQVHQSEIVKNSQFIQELHQNFINLKEHLQRQKELTLNEERKNKLFRDQIQRTNKILKSKNSKIQEFAKKIAQLEKENENLKPLIGKNEQYAKTITNFRSKFSSSEELIQELKENITEKQKDIQRHKEKIASFEIIKAKQDDLDIQVKMRDQQVRSLKQSINDLYAQKNRDAAQKNIYERKIQAMQKEIQSLKEIQSSLNSKIIGTQKKFNENKAKLQRLQSEYKERQSRLKDKEQDESNIRQQFSQLKSKANAFQNEISQRGKLIEKKDGKIEKQAQKIKELENIMGQTYKQKERLKSLQQKIGLLKQKANSLQSVYSSIVPQIQCPFGHELHNPVTIIPCGHNYCLGCKKGYLKDCMQCNGKLKIEAVYRNELMDDIIGIVGGIKSVIEILK